jgi:TRAP transporter 4TM/12TM fusion protein
LRARKKGLKGLPKEELPSVWRAITDGGHMFIALFVLVVLLLLNYSPAKSAFWAIITLLITSMLRPSSRLSIKGFFKALEAGAKQSLGIFSALACVGIIVGVISLTGLGVKFSILVTSAAGEKLFLALVYVAIASLILGMGLPPVAAYLLLIVISGPALESLGVLMFAAHMFVFYFCAMAPITPPVALAAYTAAGISGGNPMATGWIATRLGIVGFIVPFIFVYSPELLLFGDFLHVIWAVFTAAIGALLLAVALEGYLLKSIPTLLRVITACGALLMIIPGLYTDIVGITLTLILFLQQLYATYSFSKTAKGIEASNENVKNLVNQK